MKRKARNPHSLVSKRKNKENGSFHRKDFQESQQLRFGAFREGVFQKMPALEGAISERNCCEICSRKSPQNTEKNKKQSSAQRFLNDPFPKTPFFSC